MRPKANQRSRPMGLLLQRLGGEGPVLEREPEALPAALDDIPGPVGLGQRDLLAALRTAHPIGKTRHPAVPVGPHPEGMPRSVRALHEVTRLDPLREIDIRAAIRASDHHGRQIPRSRFRRPRSKPTTTSSSTVMTGTAIRPVRAISSSRAAGSSATFFAVNVTA